ncbi:MAG: ribonuclease P protein component [Acidobacteriales bacterium]|nr:ribonuclease P protein component [Terriglobales bacterium]
MSAVPRDQHTFHGYSKEFRLRKHADYDRVYKQGRRQFSQNMTFFVLNRDISGAEPRSVRIGITVGRALGGAVDRNRIKRRMREAVRSGIGLLDPENLPLDIVINPKKPVMKQPFEKLCSEVARGFIQIATQAHAR